jgi:hypothetical protein
METITNLHAAIEAHKPALAASFTSRVESMFGYLVSKFGVRMDGIYNTTSAKVWRETLSPLCSHTRANDLRRSAEYHLNPEKVAKAAAEYANQTTAAWEAKIQAKLGELDSATVHCLEGVRFRITGTRAGRAVEIQQDMILNVSAKGTVFNQFPARIYIDRKFTSETAYKRLFAPQQAQTI